MATQLKSLFLCVVERRLRNIAAASNNNETTPHISDTTASGYQPVPQNTTSPQPRNSEANAQNLLSLKINPV